MLNCNLVGIVASNGDLTHDASLKGSHFVQLCNQRNIPLLFLQNTTSQSLLPPSVSKAEQLTNRLKAQASMIAAVACATVPKITVVIGGSLGGERFAMCGRSYEPNFLFLWPNARIGLLDATRLSWSDQKDEGWTDEKEFSTQLNRPRQLRGITLSATWRLGGRKEACPEISRAQTRGALSSPADHTYFSKVEGTVACLETNETFHALLCPPMRRKTKDILFIDGLFGLLTPFFALVRGYKRTMPRTTLLDTTKYCLHGQLKTQKPGIAGGVTHLVL
ncbi:methylmalonyl-CoA decarboxylase subunit alpha-like isoform X1 [Eleutherodactylus coqui]|uniref:methylmalonyl-CoA decarboxylase subunit alpha-like isoform X1 n=1 Tax=Eleutherodactylus coqui TaxID=57060 RepID=UPI0034626244